MALPIHYAGSPSLRAMACAAPVPSGPTVRFANNGASISQKTLSMAIGAVLVSGCPILGELLYLASPIRHPAPLFLPSPQRIIGMHDAMHTHIPIHTQRRHYGCRYCSTMSDCVCRHLRNRSIMSGWSELGESSLCISLSWGLITQSDHPPTRLKKTTIFGMPKGSSLRTFVREAASHITQSIW